MSIAFGNSKNPKRQIQIKWMRKLFFALRLEWDCVCVAHVFSVFLSFRSLVHLFVCSNDQSIESNENVCLHDDGTYENDVCMLCYCPFQIDCVRVIVFFITLTPIPHVLSLTIVYLYTFWDARRTRLRDCKSEKKSIERVRLCQSAGSAMWMGDVANRHRNGRGNKIKSKSAFRNERTAAAAAAPSTVAAPTDHNTTVWLTHILMPNAFVCWIQMGPRKCVWDFGVCIVDLLFRTMQSKRSEKLWMHQATASTAT